MVEIEDTSQDIDQMHRGQALRDGEPDNLLVLASEREGPISAQPPIEPSIEEHPAAMESHLSLARTSRNVPSTFHASSLI
jgi:hypothetical protein